MAQDFSLRHPLIDGHGNFGSPDPNDRPAAMRYCVVSDTRVRTVDGTPRIADLASGRAELRGRPRSARSSTGDGDPVLADRLFHSGDHPTLPRAHDRGLRAHRHVQPPGPVPRVAGWRPHAPVEAARRARRRVTTSRSRVSVDPMVEDLTEHEQHLAVLARRLGLGGLRQRRTSRLQQHRPSLLRRVLAAYDAVVGGRRYVSERVLKSGRTIFELDVHNLDRFHAEPAGRARRA